jgi:NADH dehydrogenase FAD-containing subunit
VLVVGGGLTGIEVATELAERYRGLRLTLATANRLTPNFSSAADLHFRQRLESLGVDLREGSAVEGLEAGQAYLAGGEALPVDLCVWSAGFQVPSLAREAGLAVDRDGRALLDETLRSASHPNIFVVGDAARAECGGAVVRMSCATALPMGAQAGENVRRLLQGAEPQPFDMGFALRCVSLGRRDALVQFVDPADRPRPKVWTHRGAAITKEMICRMAYYTPMLELKTGRALYRWPASECPAPQPLGMTERPGESLP